MSYFHGGYNFFSRHINNQRRIRGCGLIDRSQNSQRKIIGRLYAEKHQYQATIIMRPFSLLCLVFFICNAFAAPMLHPRGYQHGSGYRKFDKERDVRVTKTMVEYWSRPDVLPYLPDGVKDKVEEWLQRFPQWYYQPKPKPVTPPPQPKKKVTEDDLPPCITQ